MHTAYFVWRYYLLAKFQCAAYLSSRNVATGTSSAALKLAESGPVQSLDIGL